jgi:hypothetical protein
MTAPAIFLASQPDGAAAVQSGEPGRRADGRAAGERSRLGAT